MGYSALDLFYWKAKEHGLKITPQRTAIYQELQKAKNHPSAEEIHRRILETIPNISFDTVNRTLSTFSRIGLIKVVEGSGQAKRYDPDTGLHHHFRCVRCGRIIDVHDKGYDDLPVPDRIKDRFTVTGQKVVLEGVCAKCIRGKIS